MTYIEAAALIAETFLLCVGIVVAGLVVGGMADHWWPHGRN